MEEALLFLDRREIENKKLINRMSNLESDLRGMYKAMGKESESQKVNISLLTYYSNFIYIEKNNLKLTQCFFCKEISCLMTKESTIFFYHIVYPSFSRLYKDLF